MFVCVCVCVSVCLGSLCWLPQVCSVASDPCLKLVEAHTAALTSTLGGQVRGMLQLYAHTACSCTASVCTHTIYPYLSISTHTIRRTGAWHASTKLQGAQWQSRVCVQTSADKLVRRSLCSSAQARPCVNSSLASMSVIAFLCAASTPTGLLWLCFVMVSCPYVQASWQDGFKALNPMLPRYDPQDSATPVVYSSERCTLQDAPGPCFSLRTLHADIGVHIP